MSVTVMFGAMTLGSALWGNVAAYAGLPAAHFLAAAGAVIAIPLTWRWKLQTGVKLDLSPSLSWPPPLTLHEVGHDRGPVLVSVEYRVDLTNRVVFLAALRKLERGRRHDGAYSWGIFEDGASEGRFLETFMVESWLEHLRHTSARPILTARCRIRSIASVNPARRGSRITLPSSPAQCPPYKRRRDQTSVSHKPFIHKYQSQHHPEASR